MNLSEEKDKKFLQRIQNTIQIVQAWDADPYLWQIPWDELRCVGGTGGKPNTSAYIRPDEDYRLSGNALLLQRLCRYFRKSMTWINAPNCMHCKSKDHCTFLSVRGPETQEEREGNASRVEGQYRTGNTSIDSAWSAFVALFL